MGVEFDISNRDFYDDISSYEDSAGPYEGFFYVLDLDGECVKIGSTTRPSKRMLSLTHIFRDYSNFACPKVYISSPHVNYRDNEARLLKLYGLTRKPNTEICRIRYSDVIGAINENVETIRVTHDYIKDKEDAFEATKNTLMHSLGYDREFRIRKFYQDEAYASMFSFILSEEVRNPDALYFVEVIEKAREHWLSIFANSFQCSALIDGLIKWGVIDKGSELLKYYNKSQSEEFIRTLLGGDKTTNGHE